MNPTAMAAAIVLAGAVVGVAGFSVAMWKARKTTVTGDDSHLQEDRSASRLIEAGAQLAGTTGGGALGLYAGGPSGAVAGAAAGSALSSLLADTGRRLLGHREEVRMGAAARWTDKAYKERIENGDQLRDD